MTQCLRSEGDETSRPVTVRLGEEQHSELGWLADVDNTNLADQLRTACGEYVQARKSDPELPAQIEAARLALRAESGDERSGI